MSILVDANVLSEATRPRPQPRVLEWLSEHEGDLVVDPIVLGEIRFGVFLLPKGKRRDRLELWLDEGVDRIECLPWTAATGRRWARLLAELQSVGRAMPIKDSLIAATALLHKLPVATRNRRDFEQAGVEVLDPFAGPD